MKTKELIIVVAVAAVVLSLAKKKNGALGWWMNFVAPGSQQAAMLAQQDHEFYSTGYTAYPTQPVIGSGGIYV